MEALSNSILYALEQSPFLMVAKDINLEFTSANRRWLNAAGFDNEELIIGKQDTDCAWAEKTHLYLQHEADTLNNIVYTSIQPTLLSSGEQIWMNNYKFPIIDDKNKIQGIMVIAHVIEIPSWNKTLCQLDEKNRFNLEQYFIGKPVFENLTKRESEVLFFIARGKSTKCIANILNISSRTVEKHVENIKIKFNCRKKNEIIDYAISQGYIAIIPNSLLSTHLKDMLTAT